MLPPGASELDTGPSDVIFPQQQITIRFNHTKHLGKDIGTTCKTCHAGAYRSTSANDALVPSGELCDACHSTDHSDLAHVKAGDDAMGQCAFCHVGYKAERRATWSPALEPAAREPALQPQGPRRPEHRLLAVPRRRRPARARDARPAPADARLLQLPPEARLGLARRGQERLRHVPLPGRPRHAHQDDVRDRDAHAAAVAPQRGAHARLHRAAQEGRGGRLAVLRELPQGRLLHRLPRRARPPADAFTRTTT